MDELIKKSGITTKGDASQFKYGQEAQIVPAAYLPSNTIVLYRDNISIFSKLLSFKKKWDVLAGMLRNRVVPKRAFLGFLVAGR